MDLLRNVTKKSIIIVLPAVAAAIFYEPRRLPLGIFLGWLFGIINLRSLSRNVAGLLGEERATARLLFLNMARLIFMIVAISMLVYYKVVNVFGLLIGFTVVFTLIMVEGLKANRPDKDIRK